MHVMRSGREFRVGYSHTTKLLEKITILYKLCMICHSQLWSQFSRQNHLPWYSLKCKSRNVRLPCKQITNLHTHRENMNKRLSTQRTNFRIRTNFVLYITNYFLKLRGLSPHANYTDRAAAAGRRS